MSRTRTSLGALALAAPLVLAPLTAAPAVADPAPGEELYVTEYTTPQLHLVDTGSADAEAGAALSPLEVDDDTSFSGADYDPTTGTTYLITSDRRLVGFDHETGAVTSDVDLTLTDSSGLAIGNVVAIDIDPDGTGRVVFQAPEPGDAYLGTIDLTTGIITPVGGLVRADDSGEFIPLRDVTALAGHAGVLYVVEGNGSVFRLGEPTEPPAPEPTVVPTPQPSPQPSVPAEDGLPHLVATSMIDLAFDSENNWVADFDSNGTLWLDGYVYSDGNGDGDTFLYSALWKVDGLAGDAPEATEVGHITASESGADLELGALFFAPGDAATTPDDELAATGTDDPAPVIAAVALLLLVGAALVAARQSSRLPRDADS